jgi:hypothetical protein
VHPGIIQEAEPKVVGHLRKVVLYNTLGNKNRERKKRIKKDPPMIVAVDDLVGHESTYKLPQKRQFD